MEQNKKHITPENITEWLCSTGYLFPRNELELARFEKLFSDKIEDITGKEVSVERIINGQTDTLVIKMPKSIDNNDFNYKMVARNGIDLPSHILDKMKKNQNKDKNGNGSSEETVK